MGRVAFYYTNKWMEVQKCNLGFVSDWSSQQKGSFYFCFLMQRILGVYILIYIHLALSLCTVNVMCGIDFLFLLRFVSLCCQTTIVSSIYIHIQFYPFAISLKVLFYLLVVHLLWYRQHRGIYDQLLRRWQKKSPRCNFILNIICKY